MHKLIETLHTLSKQGAKTLTPPQLIVLLKDNNCYREFLVAKSRGLPEYNYAHLTHCEIHVPTLINEIVDTL